MLRYFGTSLVGDTLVPALLAAGKVGASGALGLGAKKAIEAAMGKRQKGGLLPLAAIIPALIAVGKAVALGAASGAGGFGVKKALEAVTSKSGKRKPSSTPPPPRLIKALRAIQRGKR